MVDQHSNGDMQSAELQKSATFASKHDVPAIALSKSKSLKVPHATANIQSEGLDI